MWIIVILLLALLLIFPLRQPVLAVLAKLFRLAGRLVFFLIMSMCALMITTPKVLHNALVPMSRVLTRNLLPGVKWIDDLPRIMPLVPKAARPFNNDPVRPVEPPYDIENIPGISPPSESNPPSRWPSFEQISDDVLASVDEALKKGDYDFAVRKLELLLANHGPQPELTLRMGLAELGRGKVADAAARFNMTSLRRLQDPAAFFDEINVRILSDVSPVERENYHHVAAFYDWLDHEAHTGQALGRPMISAYDEQLQLEYRLATRPRGDPLTRETLAAIDPASEVVYVDDQLANIYGADAPGPANMDWYAVVDAVLLELAEGELPPLVVLHDVGLAHFRPAAIYLGEGVEGDIVARRYTPCITLEQPARNFGSNEGDNEGDIVARSSPPCITLEQPARNFSRKYVAKAVANAQRDESSGDRETQIGEEDTPIYLLLANPE